MKKIVICEICGASPDGELDVEIKGGIMVCKNCFKNGTDCQVCGKHLPFESVHITPMKEKVCLNCKNEIKIKDEEYDKFMQNKDKQ